MVIYLGIKILQSRKERKYTWQKNARISCSRNDCKYTWEKTARISVIILKQMADHMRVDFMDSRSVFGFGSPDVDFPKKTHPECKLIFLIICH